MIHKPSDEVGTIRRAAWRGMALLIVLPVSITLVAKKPRSRLEPSRDEGPAARLSEAPASARSLENPLAGDPQAVAAGHKLFLRHCAECHGRDGTGLGPAANLHSPALESAPPGALFWAIRNGRLPKGMPSWSNLPDQRIWQLVTYLKSLHTTHGTDRR